MKFSIKKTGQTSLLVALCVLASACNPDEFFPIEEFLTGEDAYCYEAKDLNSCQERSDRCQPAYVEADEQSEDAGMELAFLVCIANPKPVPVDDGSTTGGTDGSTVGGTDGGVDGSTAGSTDGSATAGSTDGSATAGSTDGSATAGSTDGSATAGSTDGSATSGSTDGSGAGGSTGGSEPVEVPPTLEDALASKCQNLSSEYLWEKTETKKGKVIGKTSKVKVCHSTRDGGAHSIVIACPALKAHIKHQQSEDYLGACK